MFYTGYAKLGNRILHKWIDDDGFKHQSFKQVQVELFTSDFNGTLKNSKYRSITGEPLKRHEFAKIGDAIAFKKEHTDIEGYEIHGNQNYLIQDISNNYPFDIDYDLSKLKILTFDIESEIDKNGGSFSDYTKNAIKPITAITVSVNKKQYYTFAYKDDFDTTQEGCETIFVKSKDEKNMLVDFLLFWKKENPDIVSGWNILNFDIPYIIHRVQNVLGDDATKLLAPSAYEVAPSFAIKENHNGTYTLQGVAILDYFDLYKKFTFKERENYKLDTIAFVELNERKLDYSEYGDLNSLYENDFQKYIKYNIRDVKLVDRLDDKLQLFELVVFLAYKSKIPFESVLSQVAMWDSFIYNELKKDNIVVPPKVEHKKTRKYRGAVVFDPIIAFVKWVLSFDLDGLYPHLIMQYGISPEVLIDNSSFYKLLKRSPKDFEILEPHWDGDKLDLDVDRFIQEDYQTELQAIKNLNLTVTANGALFDMTKDPLLPRLMKLLYSDRKGIKRNQLDAEAKMEKLKHANLKDSDEYKKYESIKNRCKVMQMGIKVFLNSCYGTLGTEYSRYYNIIIAEGITLSGQLSIFWIKNDLNKFLNRLVTYPVELTQELIKRGI